MIEETAVRITSTDGFCKFWADTVTADASSRIRNITSLTLHLEPAASTAFTAESELPPSEDPNTYIDYLQPLHNLQRVDLQVPTGNDPYWFAREPTKLPSIKELTIRPFGGPREKLRLRSIAPFLSVMPNLEKLELIHCCSDQHDFASPDSATLLRWLGRLKELRVSFCDSLNRGNSVYTLLKKATGLERLYLIQESSWLETSVIFDRLLRCLKKEHMGLKILTYWRVEDGKSCRVDRLCPSISRLSKLDSLELIDIDEAILEPQSREHPGLAIFPASLRTLRLRKVSRDRWVLKSLLDKCEIGKCHKLRRVDLVYPDVNELGAADLSQCKRGGIQLISHRPMGDGRSVYTEVEEYILERDMEAAQSLLSLWHQS